MEASGYCEKERTLARKLWHDSAKLLVGLVRSAMASVEFSSPLDAVAEDYVTMKSRAWINSGQPVLEWEDEHGRGKIGDLVILPVLTGRDRRTHAAIFSFMAGVTPPMPMFGRSLL